MDELHHIHDELLPWHEPAADLEREGLLLWPPPDISHNEDGERGVELWVMNVLSGRSVLEAAGDQIYGIIHFGDRMVLRAERTELVQGIPTLIL